MNVSIIVPSQTSQTVRTDLQALIARYLRQHGVTTLCVTVSDATPANVDDYLGRNPVFMHEAGVYDTPREPGTQIPATADLQMSLMPEEVLAGTPVSLEPSRTSSERQVSSGELPPS